MSTETIKLVLQENFYYGLHPIMEKYIKKTMDDMKIPLPSEDEENDFSSSLYRSDPAYLQVVEEINHILFPDANENLNPQIKKKYEDDIDKILTLHKENKWPILRIEEVPAGSKFTIQATLSDVRERICYA